MPTADQALPDRPRTHASDMPPNLLSASTEPLTPDVERDLIRAYQETADPRALDTLVRANLRLVASIANEYVRHSVPTDDLWSAGCAGLLTAIARYDARYGTPLITYATPWIRRCMRDVVSYHAGIVRLPDSALEARRHIARTKHRLECQRLRHVPDQEAAQHTAHLRLITVGAAARYHLANAIDCHLDAEVPHDPTRGRDLHRSLTIADLLVADPPPDSPDPGLLDRMCHALATMDDRLCTIITRHYGLDGSQPQAYAEIAAGMSLSRQRVHQLHDRAIGKLRRAVLSSNWHATRCAATPTPSARQLAPEQSSLNPTPANPSRNGGTRRTATAEPEATE